MMFTSAYQRSVVVLFLIGLLSFAPGAIVADEIAGVEGQIKLDGKPVPGGRIIFHQADGQFVGAKIKKDGKFKVDRVVVGQHTVTIEFKGAPEKYASDETSALRVVVTNETNIFDFELASK